MSIKNITSKIENSRSELAKVCSDLVKFPSQHPIGRTVECVDYIKEYFERHGIPTEIHSQNDVKPNIVAHIKGASNKRIMWVGHLDVVQEGDLGTWTYPPYSGAIQGNLIWGRGSSDMKGGCAAAMVAAKTLAELEEVPHNIDFWFTSDEEIGSAAGARWLAETQKFKGDVCIIGDASQKPDFPGIDIGCKGGMSTKLVARGKTAHGSRPYLGDNAIDKLMEVVPHVKKIAEYKLELPQELEPLIQSSITYLLKDEEFKPNQVEALKKIFNYPSVSLTILNGGIRGNVVPDHAEAQFDIRLTPGCKPMKVRERILELVNEANVPEVMPDVRVSETAGYYESTSLPFVNQLSETVNVAAGKKPVLKILLAGTDAMSVKRYLGIPCLGFGSSIEGQAHAPNEHASIEMIELCSKVYALFPILYQP